eukprot:g45760.t1
MYQSWVKWEVGKYAAKPLSFFASCREQKSPCFRLENRFADPDESQPEYDSWLDLTQVVALSLEPADLKALRDHTLCQLGYVSKAHSHSKKTNRRRQARADNEEEKAVFRVERRRKRKKRQAKIPEITWDWGVVETAQRLWVCVCTEKLVVRCEAILVTQGFEKKARRARVERLLTPLYHSLLLFQHNTEALLLPATTEDTAGDLSGLCSALLKHFVRTLGLQIANVLLRYLAAQLGLRLISQERIATAGSDQESMQELEDRELALLQISLSDTEKVEVLAALAGPQQKLLFFSAPQISTRTTTPLSSTTSPLLSGLLLSDAVSSLLDRLDQKPWQLFFPALYLALSCSHLRLTRLASADRLALGNTLTQALQKAAAKESKAAAVFKSAVTILKATLQGCLLHAPKKCLPLILPTLEPALTPASLTPACHVM